MNNKLLYNTSRMLIAAFITLVTLSSCEQDMVEAELAAAPGGGTMSTFKAYTIDAAPDSEVYGRVVFWKDGTGKTLVQVSLYNTEADEEYGTRVFEGDVETVAPDELMSFYTINGNTGEFGTHKFYVISDTKFFEGLTMLDAHIRILSGNDVIALGNVGKNTSPVAMAG